jgi:hypothetical protein
MRGVADKHPNRCTGWDHFARLYAKQMPFLKKKLKFKATVAALQVSQGDFSPFNNYHRFRGEEHVT